MAVRQAVASSFWYLTIFAAGEVLVEVAGEGRASPWRPTVCLTLLGLLQVALAERLRPVFTSPSLSETLPPGRARTVSSPATSTFQKLMWPACSESLPSLAWQIEPPKASSPAPGGQVSRFGPGHGLLGPGDLRRIALEELRQIEALLGHGVPLALVRGNDPDVADGRRQLGAAPAMSYAPRIMPTIGPQARCEPWTPVKLLG